MHFYAAELIYIQFGGLQRRKHYRIAKCHDSCERNHSNTNSDGQTLPLVQRDLISMEAFLNPIKTVKINSCVLWNKLWNFKINLLLLIKKQYSSSLACSCVHLKNTPKGGFLINLLPSHQHGYAMGIVFLSQDIKVFLHFSSSFFKWS